MILLKRVFNLIIICFSFFLYSQKNENIYDINYRILENSSVFIESNITLKDKVTDLEISLSKPFIEKIDLKKNQLNFNIEEDSTQFNVKFFSLKKNEKFNFLSLSYSLVNKNKVSTRNFYSDSNQFYLLPDMKYLPMIKGINNQSIYKVTIENEKNYTYVEKDFSKNTSEFPYVILGNFNVKEKNKIKSYIPVDFKYNDEKFQLIYNEIENAYQYFLNIYGAPKIHDAFKVFFLKRTGGHGLPSGLILDQEYLRGDQRLTRNQKVLIAHEVAHFWWGNTVKCNSSLSEGLAEYSALNYLLDEKKYNIKEIYINKNFELEVFPLQKMRFDTLLPYSNIDYKKFSYVKLPILLRNIEYKIGKNELLKTLKLLFEEHKKSNEVIEFDKFVEYFNGFNIREELSNDIFSTSTNEWSDFYIKSCKDNQVIFASENVFSSEKVPIKITNIDNNVYRDTIIFKKDSLEYIKNYKYQIKEIVIDPDFITNQKTSINDYYCKDFASTSSSSSKYGKIYSDKYYRITDKLIEFLFYNDIDLQTLTKDINTEKLLKKIVNSTRKITIKGVLLSLNKENDEANIFINFITPNKECINGYISVTFTEENIDIYLKSINKVNL